MARHLEPQQLLPAVAQHQKREQPLKGQGRNHTQINGSDRLRWLRKNVFQLCDGGPPCTMYFETVEGLSSEDR